MNFITKLFSKAYRTFKASQISDNSVLSFQLIPRTSKVNNIYPCLMLNENKLIRIKDSFLKLCKQSRQSDNRLNCQTFMIVIVN